MNARDVAREIKRAENVGALVHLIRLIHHRLHGQPPVRPVRPNSGAPK